MFELEIMTVYSEMSLWTLCCHWQHGEIKQPKRVFLSWHSIPNMVKLSSYSHLCVTKLS